MTLNPRPLYEEVAERLRTSIFSHEFAPGDWIDEQALAIQYGISRTPMREAIKVLAAEGLITMKMRRGAYVTEVSKSDLSQIFTVLALLEGQACREVTQKATEKELEDLDSIHLKLERSAADRDLDQFFAINQQFHDKIQEICANPWMQRVIHDLRKVLKLQRRDSLSKRGRLESSLLEHRKILSALLARDAELSENLMKEHLLQGQLAAR
ncbi:GntR family transcriptional regulator [Polynucleobacter sp. 30F-ANTBAC]|jgi:DNA-binding GntR family transcriptional regulator|uniref:GntR family transcriptional regulator n=1 Tax=Polynucleobacter sp. 30F-ANTBAC TaxID=2689095 RepID=UPI001C0C470F|nr:GntR family transcriptional regulator [Polynucleobacter sp. 30F-ANTBAC]MBU3599041.1 GntR family transcriptional regulator [Polynucleobacter sp. 30F-ANTBAC]